VIIETPRSTDAASAPPADAKPNGLVLFSPARMPSGDTTGKVVHLVDLATDDLFSFLAAASSALADAQVEQTIVFVNTPTLNGFLPRIHASVRVVVTPPARNPLRRWHWALKTFRAEIGRSDTRVVHLYGPLASLVGTWVAHRAGVVIASNHSPSSANFPAWFRGLVALVHRTRTAPLAAVPARASTSEPTLAVLERPVNPELFSMPRHEARHPLVVTGSHMGDANSADLFAQLAVLLGGEDLGLAFNWVGNVEEALQLRLKAAQVGVIPVRSATEWATRLTAGWVYLAPGSSRGALPQLVEAMALGLPCIAVDTADHRSIIRHGENGYLCHTAEEIVRCIAPLIDSHELRLKIGRAAREEVEQRFGETRFRETLFAAYQLPPKASRAAA
jgi:hypothetical protein